MRGVQPTSRIIVFVGLTALSLGVLVPSRARAVVFQDGFAAGARSPFWGYFLTSGATLDQSANRLDVTRPAGASSFVGYLSNCTVAGDFQAEVSYTLVTTPTFPPGYTAGIYGFSATFLPLGGTIRAVNPVDQYMTFAFLGSASTFPTGDTMGRIRLTRTNALAQGEFSTDGGMSWTGIGGAVTYSTVPARLLLGLASSGATSVAFDDFTLTGAGTLSCPLNQLCGDGTTQSDLAEQCDDGNATVGDGCCACRNEPLPTAPDVSGGWQQTIVCGGVPTAVRTVALTQTPGSGVATVTPSTTCGTIALEGQLRDVTGCNMVVDDAQVCGSTFGYWPAAGDDATFAGITVAPTSQLGACSAAPVTRVVARRRYNGAIEVDGTTAVRIAGPATESGTALYQGMAAVPCAEIAGSVCDFEMRRNTADVGSNVTVEPRSGFTITFENVSQPVEVLISPQATAPVAPPANFQIVGLDSPFVNVTATGDFDSATACFPYKDANDDDVVDGTGIPVTALKVLHLEGGSWVDVTDGVDTNLKRVCARVGSFSPFTVGIVLVCGDGIHTSNEECEDGNTQDDDGCSAGCTWELCRSYPRGGCRAPAPTKGLLKIKAATDPAKSLMAWKWAKGAATDKEEFGNPLDSESYRWCVYSGGVLVSTTTIEAGGTCDGKPCWLENTTGFKFKDKAATPDGAIQLQLKAGVDEKASAKFKGRGANLDVPAPMDLASPVVVELRQSSDGTCWSTTFSAPFKVQTATGFADKSD
jgi:cysteine-rich repeat protein